MTSNEMPSSDLNINDTHNMDKQKKSLTTGDVITWRSMGIKQKWNFLSRNITVEPMVACYIMPSVLASLATQNLNLEKACRVNLGYSDKICGSLAARNTSGYEEEETAVQQLVAGMQTWKLALQSGLPTLLILFLGAWSDRTGLRKPCMLMPIVGEFLTSVSLIACTYWFYELPMEAAGVSEALWPALTGGWFTMFMAIFSYIGDITTVESRTLRIGAVNVFLSLGVPIGMALSGILYIKIGFYGIFAISTVCYVLSFVYGLVVIKEPPRRIIITTDNKNNINNNNNTTTTNNNNNNNKIHNNNNNYSSSNNNNNINSNKNINIININRNNNDKSSLTVDNNVNNKKMGIFRSIMDFFAFRHISETFRVAFKKGENNRQQRVSVLMIIVMVVVGPMYGEMAVMYLFTRYRFNWNEVNFSMFTTYSMVTNLIGTMVSMALFSHFLKIDDALVGVMSCMSKILACFIYAFATEDWMLYIAPLVEIVNGTAFIAMRSIASKLVPTDELGKVNSLFGVCESLMPLVYGPMYSSIYAATMNTFPGTFFLLGGCLTIPAVISFLWLYREHRRDRVLLEHQMRKTKYTNSDELGDNAITMIIENDNNKKGIEANKISIANEKHLASAIGIDNPTFITEHL